MEILFVLSSGVALAGTLLLITQKHAVYALLGLLIAFAASAGIFLSLDAPFIAVSQILIYAGALAVMFLFVLMFTDTRTADDVGRPPAVVARAAAEPPAPKLSKRKLKAANNPLKKLSEALVMPQPMAVVVSLSLLACFVFAIVTLPASYNEFGDLPAAYDGTTFEGLGGEARGADMLVFGETEAVSRTIFEGFPLAFEVVSLLIFAALLGAVLLARRHLAGVPGTQDVAKEHEHA